MVAVRDPMAVYDDLVHQPRSKLPEIATRTGISTRTVRSALDDLCARGMVVRMDVAGQTRWEAQPPDTTDLLAAEERRLGALREQMARLTDVYWFARRESTTYPAVEVLCDGTAVFEQSLRIISDAQEDVRWFDCPPYLFDYGDPGSRMRQQLAAQQQRMAAGVRCRTIYRSDVFAEPGHGERAMASVADGEQARALPSLPMKMVIGDRRQAMIPLDPPGLSSAATLVVSTSGLLDALVSIFETLWALAVPVAPDAGESGVHDTDKQILTMMAAGLTDDAIARQLNVSRRTVVRRSAGLLEKLGARTRFQAGIQASRLGWL